MNPVNLSQIVSGDDQPLDELVVQRLVEEIRKGKSLLRPVLMNSKDDRYVIIDGRHRIEAARRCSDEAEIEAYVIEEVSPETFRKLRQALNERRSEN